ncbi:DNA primase [Oleispirillum naphthae]|uniref:DNA primase n=1 Tax=Oleispirillum naphthae TaxID=2838853 RepID=UPI0030825DFB
MSLPRGFLDELRARVPIADVVARKVKLVRKGHEYSGLCPFHSEKTPSFTVSADKGFYHCFGCGAHGDVLSFEMRANGLSFMEAVERLAAQAGMDVPQATPEEAARSRRDATVLEALEAACKFYEQKLRMPEGRAAAAYAARRELSEETVARFRLGYAPAGNALKAALLRDGWEEATLAEAGLIGIPDDGRSSYDILRDRLTFAIADRRGRVIAFGGRILGDGQPKYLNSPDSAVFHKGRVLYGLAQARAAAFEAGRVIVAEGYMDVIALSQAGLAEAVAPLGTALTEGHLAELWRLCDEPILCFDGDAAGQRAARRAAERALPELKPGRSLRFALMVGGKDPDELIKSAGRSAMEAVLTAARPLADVLWEMTVEGRDLATPERRAALERDIKELAGRIGDDSVRAQYQQELRGRMFDLFRAARPAPAPRNANRRFEPRPPVLSGPPPAQPTAARANECQLAAGLYARPLYALRHLETVSRIRVADARAGAFLDALLGVLADVREEVDDAALSSLVAARVAPEALAPVRDWAERMRWAALSPFEADGRIADLVATLKDAALAEEIAAVQAAMEGDPSDALWQRLRALRQERERLRGLDGES